MTKNPRFFLVTEGLVLSFLLALRVATIYQAGLLDYDAVRNWQIVNEVGHGNFTQVYHHLSPGFFLLYALGPPFDPYLYFYPLVNSLFNLAGIWLLARWFRNYTHLPLRWYVLYLLLSGSSFLLISTARTFTIESPSLALFALIFTLYYRRFATPHVRYFYAALLWFALAITVNYKFILVMPLALVLEIWQRDQLLTGRRWLKGMGLLAALLPVSVLFSWLVGLRPWQYGYAYGSMFFSGDVNAANRTGFLRGDVDFYGRYLLNFEAWLLLPGILLFGWFHRHLLWRKNRLADYRIFTFWVAIGWLVGMSVLLKAPRGILFVVPLLYMLAFWGWQRVTTGYSVGLLLILLTGFGQNMYRYRTQIWPYRRTHYDQVGRYLQKYPAKNIVSAVSIMATPFLPTGVTLVPIFRPAQLDTVSAAKYTYLLLDNYIYLTQTTGFLRYKNVAPRATWTEPTLRPFYFYLEHAEFTGLTYEQTRRIYEAAQQDSVQIRLLPMAEVIKLHRQEQHSPATRRHRK